MLQVEALRERLLGPLNGVALAASEALLRNGPPPAGVEPEAEFEARARHSFECIRGHLERRPLVVSSRGVARMLGRLLRGRPDLDLDNGCLLAFALGQVAPAPLGAIA